MEKMDSGNINGFFKKRGLFWTYFVLQVSWTSKNFKKKYL